MKRAFRHATIWQAIAWFGVGLLIYLSLVKFTGPDVAVAHADKYGHVAAYAVLTYWFMQIYEGTRTRLAIACSIFALGVVLEFAQFWVGYRSLEAADAAADALGIALGWLAAPPRTWNIVEKLERAI